MMQDISQNPSEKLNIDQENAPEASTDLEDSWMVRECSVYKEEYKECTSLRGRFQQYFVYGEPVDCRQWRKDYDNCCKYRDYGDHKAAEAVIASESARREARLRAHYGNTTWAERSAPPPDWERPLPDWMVQRDENTYLAVKAKELRGELEPGPELKSYCSVM